MIDTIGATIISWAHNETIVGWYVIISLLLVLLNITLSTLIQWLKWRVR